MTDWFYAEGTTQRGPIAAEALMDLLRSGALEDTALVWREEMGQWTPAGQVPELSALRAAPIPPMLPPPMPGGAYGAAGGQGNSQIYGQSHQSAAQSEHAGFAVASLVLGIVGACCFSFLTAVPGLILGLMALSGMKKTGDMRKHGVAVAGVTISIISMVLQTLALVLWLCVFAVVVRNVPRNVYIPAPASTPGHYVPHHP